MPQRPRQHTLEEESLRYFKAGIPSEWVVRTQDPDYGIDAEVEIFEDSYSTGEKFYVQLKGSDKQSLHSALGVQLSVETAEYYMRSPLPVLIVLYHAPSKQIYSQWFHTYDPFYSRGAETVLTFRLSEDDIWGNDTPATLVEDLRFLKSIGRPGERPIDFYLECSADELHGHPSGAIKAKIREAASSSLIRIVEDLRPRHAHNSITLSPDQYRISLGDKISMTNHNHGKPYSSSEALEVLPHDVFLSIALVLGHAGRTDIAIPLLEKHAAKAKLVHDKECVDFMSNIIRSSRSVIAALNIAEALYNNPDSWGVAFLFIIPILLEPGPLSDDEDKRIRQFFENRISQFQSDGSSLSEATAHYNYANFLSFRGNDPRAAINHFNLARKCDPDYWKRPYFIAELAATLFHGNRFRLSIKMYEQAIEMGEERGWQLADSLMHDGQYEQAFNQIHAYLESPDNTEIKSNYKPRLMCAILETITEIAGSRQTRLHSMRRMDQVVKEIASSPDNQKKQKSLAEIQNDALNAHAWYELGRIFFDEGDKNMAFRSYLTAFYFAPLHPDLWMLAISSALKCPEKFGFIADILGYSYQEQGAQIIVSLSERMKSFLNPRERNEVINSLSEYLGTLPDEEKPVAVRLLEDGGLFKEYRSSQGQ